MPEVIVMPELEETVKLLLELIDCAKDNADKLDNVKDIIHEVDELRSEYVTQLDELRAKYGVVICQKLVTIQKLLDT